MRHLRRAVAAAAAALCLVLIPAGPPVLAQSHPVRAVGVATSTGDVTLTTTSETVIVSSGPTSFPSASGRCLILAWAHLTTGTGTTSYTPRIRRGTTTSGTLVGEANAQTILAAVGSTEPVVIVTSEERGDVTSVEYSLTLQQAGASGNGTAVQAGILVLVF